MYELVTTDGSKYGVKFTHFKPEKPGTLIRANGSTYKFSRISFVRLYKIDGKNITVIGQGVLRCAVSDNPSKAFARKEGFRRALRDAAGTIKIYRPRTNGDVVVGRPVVIEKLKEDGVFPYEVRKQLWDQFFTHFNYDGTHVSKGQPQTPPTGETPLPVLEATVLKAETVPVSPLVH